jgi:hypothetical protein
MAEGKNTANQDCILTAKGYGRTVVPLLALDYGPTIVATEDMGRDNRIFYPMQVQLDTFSISAVFASKAKSNDFSRWIWRYAEFASSPGTAIAVGLRVQVPLRRFDFMGFPVSGWSYHFAPVTLSDVTWVITVNFDGASPVGGQVWQQTASQFGAAPSPNDPSQPTFYPAYYGPGNTGGGPPSDVQYKVPNGVKGPST